MVDLSFRSILGQIVQCATLLCIGLIFSADHTAGLCIAAAYQAGSSMLKEPSWIPLMLGGAFIGICDRVSGHFHQITDYARVGGKVPFIFLAFAAGFNLSYILFHRMMEHDAHMSEGHHDQNNIVTDLCKLLCLGVGTAVAVTGAVVYEMTAQYLTRHYYDHRNNNGISAAEAGRVTPLSSPSQVSTEESWDRSDFTQQVVNGGVVSGVVQR